MSRSLVIANSVYVYMLSIIIALNLIEWEDFIMRFLFPIILILICNPITIIVILIVNIIMCDIISKKEEDLNKFKTSCYFRENHLAVCAGILILLGFFGVSGSAGLGILILITGGIVECAIVSKKEERNKDIIGNYFLMKKIQLPVYVGMIILFAIGKSNDALGLGFMELLIGLPLAYMFVPIAAVYGVVVFRKMKKEGMIDQKSQRIMSIVSFFPFLDLVIAFWANKCRCAGDKEYFS